MTLKRRNVNFPLQISAFFFLLFILMELFFLFVLCSVGIFVLKQNHVHNLHKESE